MRHTFTLIAISIFALASHSQTGGPYTVTQSVVSNGGGTSDGGSYSITGTTAQSVAGIQSSNGQFGARGGFWQFFLIPTAAPASISGRITDISGRPITGVRIFLEGSSIRIAQTNSFGIFVFDEVEVGRAYMLSPTHRRYLFTPQTILVNDNISDLEIVALP